jgi:hypothetical protein
MAGHRPGGPATISLGRVSRAAGTELSASGATGPWLAVVEAGSLQLSAPSGPETLLSVGQGTIVAPAPAPTLRQVGKTLWSSCW